MQTSNYASVNTPVCSNSVKRRSEVTSNRDQYDAVEIGDFAYLWTPYSYDPLHIRHLIISAHGRAIENPNPPLQVNKILTDFDYTPQTFVVPQGNKLAFFCKHRHSVRDIGFRYFYIHRCSTKPFETVGGGEVSFDYALTKHTNSINSEHNEGDESYRVIQDIMHYRVPDCINLLKRYIDDLDRFILFNEREERKLVRDIEKIKRKMEKRKKDLQRYENMANSFFSVNKQEKITASEKVISSLEHDLDDKLEFCNDIEARISRRLQNINFLFKELNEPCSILTIRDRKRYRGEGIPLSDVMSNLDALGLRYDMISCYFRRASRYYDKGERRSYAIEEE